MAKTIIEVFSRFLLQVWSNRWNNGVSAGPTDPPTMDRDGQSDAVGHDETRVEREVDPIANRKSIDHLAAGPGKGEDEKSRVCKSKAECPADSVQDSKAARLGSKKQKHFA